jgi:D-alanyl-lipoteichoic acid acyltransferase DltB (MBOAT superfamily)
MDSASLQLVFYGLVVAALSNLSKRPAWRCGVLLLASLVFLAMLAPSPFALLPFTAFLFAGYAGILVIERRRTTPAVWSVLAVVLAYTWLKKYTFLPEGILWHTPYFTLGLSYIFFRVLHLLIESRDREHARNIGISSYLLYTLNFTTLVSGPIQRYDEFARDQFAREPLPLGPRVVGRQLERIVIGFFKVNVLAMLLKMLQEDALGQLGHSAPSPVRMLSAVQLVMVYPFFLYANFSGYIDIVLALARLMRLNLPENFDRPFAASSVLDFWNRWHMTLSSWLKVYVYNPLLIALMRRTSSPAIEPYLAVFGFFVTFFLVGIWHGRTSEFVIFGILTGGGVSVNKLWQHWLTRALGRKGYKNLGNYPIYIALSRGLNYSWFAFTLLWFWGDWKQIDEVFRALSTLQWLCVGLASWVGATGVLAAWEWLRSTILSIRSSGEPLLTNRYVRVVFDSALGAAAFIITVLLNQPAPGIVYKAF